MDQLQALNAAAQMHLQGQGAPNQQAAIKQLGDAARSGFKTPQAPAAPWGTQLQDNTGGVPFNQQPGEQEKLAAAKAKFEAAMAARGLVPGQE
jgi:hypothetical protein